MYWFQAVPFDVCCGTGDRYREVLLYANIGVQSSWDAYPAVLQGLKLCYVA